MNHNTVKAKNKKKSIFLEGEKTHAVHTESIMLITDLFLNKHRNKMCFHSK